MDVITTKKALFEKMNQHQGETVGFVPTMGFLHEGHLSLVRQAKKENDVVVMSIFVNPLQFGPNEDFERYPRDEKKDKQIAADAGVDVLFIPTVDEMYPNELSLQITVTKGADVLCGKTRPGHFEGVVTVLSKLFHLVHPTNAYFGLKDAQQFAIVHQFTKDLDFPMNVIGLPIVRETDGLAKSSRNVYLSKEEREEAVALFESLKAAQQQIQEGEAVPKAIEQFVTNYLEEHTDGKIDYVSVLHYPNLKEVSIIQEQIIIAVAVHFEKARLIDNIILDAGGRQIKRM